MGKRISSLMLILAILTALGGPAVYSWARLGQVEASFSAPCATVSTVAPIQADWTPAIPSMQKHSDLLVSWAIAISGGILALITIKSLHQFRAIRLLYFLLAPALTFIVGSIWAAVAFQSRSSYLLLNNCADSEGTLNQLLMVQTDLFQCSIVVLVLFAFLCLIELVLGTANVKSSAA